MGLTIKNKVYTVEEYILLDEAGDVRHEFINGNLIEMSGASTVHNEMCQNLLFLFLNHLKSKGCKVYIESVKVKIEGEAIYFYPDIVVTNEAMTDDNKYILYAPVLIAEVLSESTRTKDLVDKFIQYRKIKSLSYYLLVEPEQNVIILMQKSESGEWLSETYTSLNDKVLLTHLDMELKLEEIYKA
jgi:Uma2 family endonuclease